MSQILEWYYFGDLVTLAAEGANACFGSAATNEGELVTALLGKCNDPEELKDLLKILKGEKNGNTGEPRLIDEIRLLGGIQRRKIYKWKNPLRLKSLKMDLKICHNVDQEVLVGPNKIVLPWPFRGGEKLKERSGYAGEYESNPESLLKISPWMQTIEDLLDDEGERRRRDEFIDPNYNPCDVLVAYAIDIKNRELEFPNGFGFDVNIKELIPRNATFISSSGSEMHINVGVLGETDGEDDIGPRYEKWPCGAFNRNIDL